MQTSRWSETGRRVWKRWFRPPRRLRFSRAGWIFTVGTVVLGVAAIPTGNNLLFLMLGAMLGSIAISGVLSELVLRDLQVRRRVPREVVAGRAVRLTYELHNPRRRLPSYAIEVGELGAPGGSWVPAVEPNSTAVARVDATWARRGVHPLEGVTLATSFPFGLFRKERDLDLPAEVVVWPRTDRPVREPRVAGERARRPGVTSLGTAGARGEYRGLREYRFGDDARDVHWRSTARHGSPVVREYERDQSQAFWLVVDLRLPVGQAPDAPLADAAAETAASIAAQAALRGRPFGLATVDTHVAPTAGPAQLERALDALARARFRPDAPPPPSPAPRAECVLVTAVAPGAGWGDVIAAEVAAAA